MKTGFVDDPARRFRQLADSGGIRRGQCCPLIALPADEVEIREGALTIAVVAQASVAPEPVHRKIIRAVMPLDDPARRTEGLGELAATAQRVELAHQIEQRLGEVLAPEEQTAERPLVDCMVLLVGKTSAPVLDLLEQFKLAVGGTHQAQVPGNPALVGGEQIVARQTLGGEIGTQVAIDQVDVAKGPEIVALQAVRMDVTQRWLDIAQLVGMSRREVDLETRRHQLAIFHVTDRFDPHVGRQVVRNAAIAEQQPVDIGVAPAAFKEERHPERPTAKIRDDEKNPRSGFDHWKLS